MPEFAVELRDVTKVFPGTRGASEVMAVDHINLGIKRGEFFTILGPSGCGKTTSLRMIAGFEMPTSGEIFISGKSMHKVPPNRRPVNTVFQNYALFPHLTIAKNVAFGLRVKRTPQQDMNRRTAAALQLVQLPDMENRRPSQLSGGQQQRVALARALVNEPDVLLLDEPLGALDLKLRKAMQLELKHLQVQLGITFIYVTHDQEEALTMSDRIAVMSNGILQQVDTPREIYERPTNRFVADFIGETNFMTGTVAEASEVTRVTIGKNWVLGMADSRSLSPGQQVTVAIRPEKISIYPQGTVDVLQTEIGLKPGELAQIFGGQLPQSKVDVREYLKIEQKNVILEGWIEETIYIGTDIRYRVALDEGVSVVARIQNFGERYDTTFHAGDKVYVHWPAENAQILTD
ncbi:MAG TPA: ABC transporter ATP-binding protein [Anaerolineae bacterium]